MTNPDHLREGGLPGARRHPVAHARRAERCPPQAAEAPEAAAISKAELARLIQSEARYRSIVEQSREFICHFQQDGTLTFVNESYCRYFGRSREELVGGSFLEFLPPQEQERIRALLESFSPEMEPVTVEHPVLGPNGSLRWNRWVNTAVVNDAGQFLEYQALGHDITETRNAQDALRDTQRFLQKMTEIIPSLVYVFDVELQRDVFVNKKALAWLGYEEGEIEAMGREFLFQCMHPDDLPRFFQHLRRIPGLRDGEVASMEYRMRHQDGSWRWFHSRDVVFARNSQGAVSQIIGIASDITDQRRVEETLRQTQADLEKAQAIGHVGSWSSELADDGRLVWSRETHRIFGIEPADFDGCVETFFRLVHLEDRDWVRQAAQTAALEGKRYQVEHRIVRPDGSVRWVHELGEIERDAAGQARRIVGVVRDITEQKHAQRTAQRLSAFPELNPNPVLEFSKEGNLTYYNQAAMQMAQLLGREHPEQILPPEIRAIVNECLEGDRSGKTLDFTINLRALSWSFFPIPETNTVHCYVVDQTERRELEEQLLQARKLESIGQLASGVAHDFNNLLTVILGNAALLGPRQRSPEEKDWLEQIVSSGERAANLTRQLLLFSRKQRFCPQPVDLNQLAGNLVKILARLLGEDITMEFAYDPALPAVQGDPGMLEQVIMNLAVNGRDAMPNGGRLQIKTELLERHSHSGEEKDFVCLTVTDTGCGIPPEIQDRIFEPFFTTKEIGQGTGLGLATVYGIVQQHGGWVELSSQVGQGTSFRIYLPAERKVEQVEAPPVRLKDLRGHGESILLVEDEPALCDLVSRILLQANYRVLAAPSGAEAVKIPAEQLDSVDLLITDMLMPGGVSGRELADHLRQIRPDLQVLFMSGYSPDESRTYLPPEEATASFLAKPFGPAELLQKVRACLTKPASG